jgi:hypothetical protein
MQRRKSQVCPDVGREVSYYRICNLDNKPCVPSCFKNKFVYPLCSRRSHDEDN